MIAMLMIWYGKVVSRLPAMVQQNINAQAPLKFRMKIKIKIIKRYKYQGYATVNLILGHAHYTKNDSRALKKVLRQRMETQHNKY